MMICKADFEELFPEIFPPRDSNGARRDNKCDRTTTALKDGQVNGVAKVPLASFAPRRRVRTSDAFAMMPAVVAYDTAWDLFATYDRFMRGYIPGANTRGH